jgi:hypothetical protein
MRKHKARVRGVYIIAALLTSVVIALFLGAALHLSTGHLKANDQTGQRALFAAESGLRYVQARLASDYTWDANDGRVVDTADMIVHEDNGNVIGIIRTPEGDFAQFRVRFNFQDDSQGDADGQPDPTRYPVDTQYISVNNILGGSPLSVPRADGPSWSVIPTSATPYEVPAGTACVIVEGRFGPGLASLSSTDMNPTTNGRVSSRVVEAYLEADTLPGADAAAMAAGNIHFKVEPGEAVSLDAKDENQASRLRSRANIKVTGGADPNLVSANGETHTVDGRLQAAPSADVQLFTEDPSTSFYKLEWDQVKKADSSDSTINGGTYVVWDDGTLHYYDMDYDSYAANVLSNPADPGTVLDPTSLPAGVSFDTSDPRKPKLTISQNLLVDGGSTDDLTIIPRKGVQEEPPDTSRPLEDMAKQVAGSLYPGDVSGSVADATLFKNPPDAAPPGDIDMDITSGPTNPFRIVVHSDHFHVLNYNAPGIEQTPGNFGRLLTQPGMTLAQQQQAHQVLRALGASGPMGELETGGEPANLRADDVEIVFDPPEGESAILSADGTVRLGTRVSGKGGSITSAKNIRIIGDGDTSLAASEKNGLSFYAQGNVTMSGLREVPVGSNNWEYKDVELKGVVYAWGDIDIKLSSNDPSVTRHGDFNLQGSIVAYGGDPAGKPGEDGNGDISMDTNNSKLIYDPVYLVQMTLTPPAKPLRQSLYNVY